MKNPFRKAPGTVEGCLTELRAMISRLSELKAQKDADIDRASGEQGRLYEKIEELADAKDQMMDERRRADNIVLKLNSLMGDN